MKTKSKTMRIPVDIINDIEKTVAEKNTSFTKEANYRLKHFSNSLTPAVMVKIQNIINTAANALPAELAEEIQKEGDELWRSLK